jgi:hypothetical protein
MNPPTWHFLSKICIFQQACKSAPDLSIASHSVTKLLQCAKCSPAEELVDLAIWPVEIMFHIVTRYRTLNVAMLLHQFQTPFVHFYSKSAPSMWQCFYINSKLHLFTSAANQFLSSIASKWDMVYRSWHENWTLVHPIWDIHSFNLNRLTELKHYKSNFVASSSQEDTTYLSSNCPLWIDE